MTAPLMPRATAVWLVENTTLTFRQIGNFCELHELEIQAIADGDVAANIVGLNPVAAGQLTAEEIARCEADKTAMLVASEPEGNVKALNSKNKKVLSPSQRSDKPAAILWVLRNCPEIIDSQICKLIGTTKPTIASLREGTHRDFADLRPKNPVAVGLCKEKDLEDAIAVSKKWSEPKKAKKKTAKKKVVKKATAKKTTTKKTAVKKASAKKAVVKKAAVKTATKKLAAKKEPIKKPAAKKETAKKSTAKKSETKKTVAKKAPAKKTAAKKTTSKKTATAKKTAKK
uniref:Cytoplasmic protein n=1 Tax=uncultured Alphaproteobacteria bacterium TaxID=91750 RepID=A0A6G8F293_9PROT|nr:hypothetical protein PlAlph_2910 [uncultured Alphaproteobacteria bacterium]